MLHSLGSGSSGNVKEVIHIPSGELMAVKVINLTSERVSRRYLCRELNTLRFTYSPYFIDFYGATLYVGVGGCVNGREEPSFWC